MTTIVWDTKVMAADTRHSSRHFSDVDGPKIFTPLEPVSFGESSLIAVAGAGNASLIDGWKDYLFETSRSMEELKEKMTLHVAANTPHQSLLILTEAACWKVWIDKEKPDHLDVTNEVTGIGSGAKYALPLIKEFGIVTAMARAARLDDQTNNVVVVLPNAVGAQRRYMTESELKEGARMEWRQWYLDALPKLFLNRFLNRS